MRTTVNYKSHGKKKKGASGKEKGSSEKGNSKQKKQGGGDFFKTLASPNAVKIYGILLMAFAIVAFLSILSFYFTFETDWQYANFGGENVADNWCGRLGAHIAVFFVNYLFGVFSIGFPFLLFLAGCKITFGKTPLPLWRTTYTTFLSMAWLSVALGCFVRNGEHDYFAGIFGSGIANVTIEATGKIATFFILLAVLLIILIICYNLSTDSILNAGGKIGSLFKRNSKNSSAKGGIADDEEDDGKIVPAEVQNLDELYISNQNELSNEYANNVIEFDTDGGAKKPGGFGKNTSKEEPPTEEVPFDFDIKTAEGEEGEVTENDEEVVPDEQLPWHQPATTPEDVSQLPDYDPRADLSHYEFPSPDLLADFTNEEMDQEAMRRDLVEKKERIEKTLKSFGIAIQKITATVGPTVTLYEIVPAEGVRISKIKNLEDDIALSLAALGIRIIAPIPGRGTIGIEVPNAKPQIVPMKDIILSDKFQNNKYELPIGLGKTISNEPFVADLAKMPHLLIAGATGQGKSVGLNAIIASLLYKKHPAELKFVLIDPKKVEFTLYGIIENHYLAMLPNAEDPIITDTKKVVNTLNSLCCEMDARYDLLKIAGVRNIKEYNAKFCKRQLSPANGHRYLPYIVLVIDEFGDLIITAGREVETPIARLAQLARAIGIHLIIATQRPSVNVITGMIKANFPSRIAFRVISVVDSRTILDCSGANQLIGKGDMLISTGSDLVRLQCAFIDTPEVEALTRHIADQQAYPMPFFLPEYDIETDGVGGDGEPVSSDAIDPCFMDAATLVVETQQGSTSLIQRRMRLGYARAGRIMDQLEEFKIVGPSMGSKVREVKVKSNEELRAIFQNMGLI